MGNVFNKKYLYHPFKKIELYFYPPESGITLRWLWPRECGASTPSYLEPGHPVRRSLKWPQRQAHTEQRWGARQQPHGAPCKPTWVSHLDIDPYFSKLPWPHGAKVSFPPTEFGQTARSLAIKVTVIVQRRGGLLGGKRKSKQWASSNLWRASYTWPRGLELGPIWRIRTNMHNLMRLTEELPRSDQAEKFTREC